MADFPTITDTISYRSENQFVCSVSDKLDGFLHRAHEFEFSNLWLVASPGDQKRLRQARQEDSVRNEANYVLLLKLGERATDRFKFQTEKISDILTPHRQRHSFRKYRKVRQAVAPATEKYRNFFLCRSVAEQQQLILCHIKFAGRKFNQ